MICNYFSCPILPNGAPFYTKLGFEFFFFLYTLALILYNEKNAWIQCPQIYQISLIYILCIYSYIKKSIYFSFQVTTMLFIIE